MKKIFYLFITMIVTFCLYTDVLKALDYDSFRCEYKIVDPDGNYMTDIRYDVSNYGIKNAKKPWKDTEVKLYFKNKSGNYQECTDKDMCYAAQEEWLNYGKNKNSNFVSASLHIYANRSGFWDGGFPRLYYDRGDITFGVLNSCPDIYSEEYYEGGSYYSVVTSFYNPSISNTHAKVKMISATEYIKDSSGNFISKKDYYNDSGIKTKEPLVCSYTMNFEKYNLTSKIDFVTNYVPGSDKKTYQILSDGSGAEFGDLDSNGYIALKGASSDEYAISSVFIDSDTMKDMFGDKCLESSKVYNYFDNSMYRYFITTNQHDALNNSVDGEFGDGTGATDLVGPQAPDISIIDKPMTCEEILGEGTKIVKLGINVLRIAGVIIALINGMMAFIPAVSSGDKGELNNAFKKCINMAIILILIVLIPELINVIGNLFGWDTSCIF